MLTEGSFVKKLKARANAQAKVRFSFDGTDIFNRVFLYIYLFNLIDEFDDRVLDARFDEIDVLDEFIPFISPKFVKFDVNSTLSKDLLRRNVDSNLVDFAKRNHLTLEDWVNIQSTIRSKFRRDMKEATTKLSEIKVGKSFNDVVDKAAFWNSYDNNVHYVSDHYYIPIFIDVPKTILFKDAYFNTNEEYVISEFLDHFSFI